MIPLSDLLQSPPPVLQQLEPYRFAPNTSDQYDSEIQKTLTLLVGNPKAIENMVFVGHADPDLLKRLNRQLPNLKSMLILDPDFSSLKTFL